MIDERCLGPDVDRARIHPDAQVTGASYLTGSQTMVGPGAVVHDARLHDTMVEAGARIADSMVIARGEPHEHRCDAAGRVVVGGGVPAVVDIGAQVIGSTLANTRVGQQSFVENSSLTDCTIGPQNSIRQAKLTLTETRHQGTVLGPTEISEAQLGHHATIDRRGYFEGVFSNTFPQVRFDDNAGRLAVVGTIDLPHVSQYGTNTINSTNSGKLLPQHGRPLESLGRHGGLWHDPLLSHEQIELGPCCWVAPWTKVVGQSAEPHADDNALVNDRLTTYLMPFSIAGVGGELTRGLVMPGELSVGLGPKQRHGAWTFTYAPGAVIAMVARLHAALDEAEKHVADTIVEEALQTAIAMTQAMAAEYHVDLSLPLDKQPRAGWPRWVAQTCALLRAHLDNRLWQFENGRPSEWHEQSGRWTHPRWGAVAALAPDAVERQVDEAAIFQCDDPHGPITVAVPGAELEYLLDAKQDPAGSQVAADARVSPHATIGPGCQIGPGAIIDAGAEVWRSVLDDCHVEPGAVVQRSIVRNSRVGTASAVRSCRMTGSQLGRDSTAEAASIEQCRLAARATVSPFTSIHDVQTDFGAILGSGCRSARIHTYFMSMHLAGEMAHVESLPTTVMVDGRPVAVPAIPMIGGGAVLRGTADAPIRLECSFVGSNAILEAGVRLGFGCFVLGRLPAGSGLPPLTLSTDENPLRQQIGGVLVSMSSTVITHFLSWAYQAAGPELAPAVAELVRQSIQQGIDAVEAELKRRNGQGSGETGGPNRTVFTSLPDYSEKQLETGLANYRRCLDSGAWDLVCRGSELWFAVEKGHWHERAGSALWIPRR